MPLFLPNYNGYPIFGTAVTMQVEPNPSAQQLEAFFGVPGQFSLFGGGRGRVFMISGVFYENEVGDLNNDEFVFDPGNPNGVATGGVAALFDTRGRTWPNVYCLGEFKPDPMGPKWAAGGGWVLPYKLIMRGLT